MKVYSNHFSDNVHEVMIYYILNINIIIFNINNLLLYKLKFYFFFFLMIEIKRL